MALISGMHHVAMTCCGAAEYEKTIGFYRDILGIPVIRTWAGGTMLNTGNCLLEIFNDGDIQLPKGTIRHFAFNVEDVDACIKAVKEAGYTVFKEPTDICIPSQPPFPARIAFCYGPLGEEIEFFHEK